MTEKLITNTFKLNSANIFITALSSGADNYYFFADKYTEYPGSDDIIEKPVDTDKYMNQMNRNMIFGKKITGSDIMQVVKRNSWEANTVFTQYDGNDSDLLNKNFFAIVNANADYHVYKCLYNNEDSPSTVEPDFNSVSVNDTYIETSDGYVWKYMYSVDSFVVDKFSTEDVFPVSSNSQVVAAATVGAIDVIDVVDPGYNYSNYLAGNNMFSAADIRLNGINTVYNISANSFASSANDFYNGCYIYIKSGPAEEIGQYKKIVDYQVNTTSKAIFLESAFDNPISIASQYDIYPGVVITGDGTQTINAVARALINVASNTVHKIDMLNIGENYKSATAFVYSYPAIGVANATITVINSPFSGHGSNPARELGAKAVVMNMQFVDTENQTILDTNDYRSVGIIKNPHFTDVNVTYKVSFGNFINSETVYKIKPLLLGSNGSLTSTNAVFTAVAGDFKNQFSAGDYIYLVAGTNVSNGVNYGTARQLAKVASVSNSSYITLTSNTNITSNAVSYYIPRIKINGTVISSNVTSMTANNVTGGIVTDDILVGYQSGAVMVANTTYRAGTAKGIDTFINTYKYKGNIISGTFIEDETVFQNDVSSANAILHSVVNDGTYDNMYVTNNFGSFDINKNINGLQSSASMSISQIYQPELVFDSGEILYIENMPPVTRQPGQKETFKVIFEF